MYALLSGYDNTTRDKFELDDMDPQDMMNKLNITCVTVLMVMMENKDNDNGVLIHSYSQLVESGIRNMMINTDGVLSANSVKIPISIQIHWRMDSIEHVINLYDAELNDRNVITPPNN